MPYANSRSAASHRSHLHDGGLTMCETERRYYVATWENQPIGLDSSARLYQYSSHHTPVVESDTASGALQVAIRHATERAVRAGESSVAFGAYGIERHTVVQTPDITREPIA